MTSALWSLCWDDDEYVANLVHRVCCITVHLSFKVPGCRTYLKVSVLRALLTVSTMADQGSFLVMK